MTPRQWYVFWSLLTRVVLTASPQQIREQAAAHLSNHAAELFTIWWMMGGEHA